MVDGELPDSEYELLIRRFAVERSLRVHWERCHLIGEAMRKDLPMIDSVGFADRLMASLADEPPPEKESSRFGGMWTRGLAGAAVAAAVAVVAIVGLRHDPHRGMGPAEIVPTDAVAGQKAPFTGDYLNGASWDGNLSPLRAALHSGIMDQDDTNGSLAGQALQPYRYVTHPSDLPPGHRRPDRADKSDKGVSPPRQP